jgi:DNA-binding transcriptional ArsR family regulator
MTDTGRPRTITDPRMLRALSHPVRLALLDALRDGPLTATQAGAAIGETPTTCSFHLRQLANYGFVEEAGGGVGRARPWRLLIESWDAPARPGDPEFMNASRVLDHVLLGRQVDRMRRFIDTVTEYPEPWQRASTGNMTKLYMTAEELAELNTAYRALTQDLIDRFADRAGQPELRPDGSLPVELFFAAYPAKPVEPSTEE